MVFGIMAPKPMVTMSSKDSKIYPGVTHAKGALTQLEPYRLPDHEIIGPLSKVERFKNMAMTARTPDVTTPQAYERPLQVLVPAGVDTSKASPFMIFLDGTSHEGWGQMAALVRLGRKLGCGCCCGEVNSNLSHAMSMVHTMDNLFKEKQLEPMVCIFVDPGAPQDETCPWGTQRNLEYDVVSNTFTDFVEQEVLPFVSEKCGVLLATDPDQRAVFGSSSGGNAAITMGLTGKFNRIIASSPSCVNQHYLYNPEIPVGGWDYHSGKELIKNQDKVQGLRVVIFTTELDLQYQSDEKHCRN